MTGPESIEKMADEVHQVWCNWMKYMFDQGHVNLEEKWIMPREKLLRWRRQMETPYLELSEAEKKSDRKLALRYIELVSDYHKIV